MLQRATIIFGHGENFCGREEGAFRAGERLAIHQGGVANHFQGLNGLTAFEADQVFLPITVNPQLQPIRERVDHGDAHSVQAA